MPDPWTIEREMMLWQQRDSVEGLSDAIAEMQRLRRLVRRLRNVAKELRGFAKGILRDNYDGRGSDLDPTIEAADLLLEQWPDL